MATQITIHEKGVTVLYEASHPRIDLVFVHGFTGHPKNTWTWQRAKHRSTEQKKKHGRNEEPPTARRLKIPKLSFGQSPRNPSTATSSIPQYDRTETSDAAGSRNVAKPEGRQEEVYWPADLASQTIPDSRILTYGYDTNIRHLLKGPVSKNTVPDHAWDLLCSLEELRRCPNESCRPLLFIAHSLGGIVVKEALRQSRRCASTQPRFYGIFEATSGFMFFGTPHRGADPRNFLHHIVSASVQLLGFKVNYQIVDRLMPDAEQLLELKDEFAVLCYERKWPVHSFQEEYGVTGLFGTKVVDDRSSCLDDPTIETKRHISENHMDMCRFYGLQDPEYLKVAAAMTFILGTIGDRKHTISPLHEQLPLRTPSDTSILYEQSPPKLPAVGSQVQDSFSPPETPSCRDERSVSDGIDATLKESLVERLFFSKIDERLTHLTAAQGRTCRWFLAKPEYTAWRDMAQQPDGGGFLWIKGNPGTGKSTLMKLLFEEARGSAKGDSSQIILSFFFLARGTIEEKSTIGLYRSFLHQLFEKTVDLRGSLEWMTAYGARGILQNGWHEEALKQTLKHAIPKLGSRSLTIFVDALDECDQSQAAGMVCFFEELCDDAKDANVKLRICFSSRHYPTVVIQQGVEVTLEAENGHADDIESYIKAELRLGKNKHAETLRAEILKKSSGIFLWVVLVLDILRKEYPNSSVSISKIRNRLEQIPPELNDLFKMILARDGENIEQLHVCLKWVLFATRPLKPQELYFAVQLGLDKERSGYWDHEDVEEDQMKTFVRTSSKGLAEVTRNKASEIQFIHESVRDFLLGRYGGQWSGAFGNFEGHCHDILKDCCLAQLNAPIGDGIDIPDALPQGAEAAQLREELHQKFPFLEYSVLNVLHHANCAQQHGREQGHLLADFPLPQWVTLNNALERHAVRRYTKSVNLLYILAEKNLADLIRIHYQPAACFKVGEERYGPPIFAALATRSHDAVEAILKSLQARVQHLSPLPDLWAQYQRDQGSRTDFGRSFVCSRRQDILSYLRERDDEAILSACIFSGQVEVDAKDKEGRTLLSRAAGNGRETIVQLLLNTGQAETDAKDRGGWTPLLYAARYGHEAVVRLLLNTGQVEVDAKDNFGRTPLSLAARSGHEAVVQLLLNTSRVEVDAKDKEGRTALSLAAENGHEAVVQLLLNTGQVEIDAKDNLGRTPLSKAAENGHEAVVQLLLNTGQVDVNAEDKKGRTPLSRAAEMNRKDVVRLLQQAFAENTRTVPTNAALLNGSTEVRIQ
ncbi:hypothetical protein RB595_010556 [Gaeumannomyces hyphopodioides]